MDTSDVANLSNQLADRLTSLTGRIWTLEDRSRLGLWLSVDQNLHVGRQWLAVAGTDGYVAESETEFELRLRIQDGLAGSSRKLGGFRPL